MKNFKNIMLLSCIIISSINLKASNFFSQVNNAADRAGAALKSAANNARDALTSSDKLKDAFYEKIVTNRNNAITTNSSATAFVATTSEL